MESTARSAGLTLTDWVRMERYVTNQNPVSAFSIDTVLNFDTSIDIVLNANSSV